MRRVKRNIVFGLLIAMLVLGGGGLSVPAAKEIPMVPANFTQLAEKAKSGVVNISTVRTVKGGGKVFRHFFGDQKDQGGN